MRNRRLPLACGLLLLPALALADGDRPLEPVTLTPVAGGGLRLVAREATWDQVLALLASEAGIRVQVRGLPPVRVSVFCEGATPRALLGCLLGPEVGLVYREASTTVPGESESTAWVLGSGMHEASVGSAGGEDVCAAKDELPAAVAAEADRGPSDTEADSTAMLLTMASAQEPEVRAEALTRLIAESPPGDAAVLMAIEEALGDPDVAVRAQAVYGMAKLGGPDWAANLELALGDPDPSVRLMAVDSVQPQVHGNWLLQEAMADPDGTVRALAALRLHETGQTESAIPGDLSDETSLDVQPTDLP